MPLTPSRRFSSVPREESPALLHCNKPLPRGRRAAPAAGLVAAALLAAALLPAAGCGGGQGGVCRVDGDCAGGVCTAEGRCVAVADGGAEGDGAPAPDAGAACRPDHDGVITAAEHPAAAGLSAVFRLATDVEVDTAGEEDEDGRRWDLAGPLEGDRDVEVELEPLAGAWFEGEFPGADYTARLGEETDLLGVFQVTGQALLLQGVVSPEDGPTATRLTYQPPVAVLRFPLEEGAAWQTESTVSGLAAGVAAFYSEEYDSEVDAAGRIDTPYGEFPVLRVSTAMTRVVGAAVISHRSFSFAAECYGTVATVRSQDHETEAEFSEAAEVRRLR